MWQEELILLNASSVHTDIMQSLKIIGDVFEKISKKCGWWSTIRPLLGSKGNCFIYIFYINALA